MLQVAIAFVSGFWFCILCVWLRYRHVVPMARGLLNQETVGEIIPGCGAPDCELGICRNSEKWEGFMVRVRIGSQSHVNELKHLYDEE